jgi:hypothetical protein
MYRHHHSHEVVMAIDGLLIHHDVVAVTDIMTAVIVREHANDKYCLPNMCMLSDTDAASPVSKGMEKIPESPDEYSVMSMDTSRLVSHI